MRGFIRYRKLISLLVAVLFIISTQVSIVLAASGNILMDYTFDAYNANLLDTGTATYSMYGNPVNLGTSGREIVVAVDTTYSMKYDFDENYDYTTFADYAIITLSEDTSKEVFSISGSESKVFGKIHSNSDIDVFGYNVGLYDKSSTYSETTNPTGTLINGTAEASGSTIQWPVSTTNPINKVTGAAKIKILNFCEAVKADPNTVTYSGNKVFDGASVTFNAPIYVDGNLTIATSNITSNGVIAAKGDITLNTTNCLINGPLCLYSGTGNISLSADIATFNGIVIAPNGKVNFSASQPIIHGRVIAKEIGFYMYKLTVDSRGTDSYLLPFLKYVEYETRLYKEKTAVKSFIDSFSSDDRTKVGVVSYAEKAKIVSGLTSTLDTTNVSIMKANIDALSPSNAIVSNVDGSYKSSRRNIGDAMRRAYYMLKNSTDAGASKYIIVLTDEISNSWTWDSITSNPVYKVSDGDSPHEAWDDISGAEGYAKNIGDYILGKYKPFFITLPGVTLSSNKTSAQSQLTNIASAAGASSIAGGSLFYSTSTETDVASAFNGIKACIPEALEYPNELPFQSVSFSQVFPQGVKVLSAQYSGSNLAISKTGEQYSVSGNLGGFKLVKNSTTGLYQLSTVPNIIVKFRYTSLSGSGGVWTNGVLNSSITFQGGKLNYIDYLGNTGLAIAPDYTIGLKFFADIN